VNRQQVTQQALYKAQVARTLLATGMLKPTRPDRALRSAAALRRWGPTPAAAYAGSAIRYPDRAAVVDDRGTLTFAEMQQRTNALAAELAAAGIREQDGVAIMCRNHRGFVDATLACSKLGASALYLNTAFAAPQLADVMAREQPKAVIYDEEFADLLDHGAEGRKRFIAWHEPGAAASDPVLEDLIARGDPSERPAPAEKGRVVILTSGTTGAPKGAARKEPESIEPMAAMLSKIPLKARGVTMIAAPMFHSWGFAHFSLALPLSSTLVLRRRFDAEDTLRAVAHHRASALALVPVMLQRILELGGETIARYDLHALRVIRAQRLGSPGRAGHPGDGQLRGRALQPLRLHRGRVGHDRHARGPPRRARNRRAAADRHGGQAAGRRRPRGAAGRGRAHLRRQRDDVRGVHGRGRQGDRGRADEHRRRRALRRGGAPLRRRARRRNDRQRRRERVPARGRGPARRAWRDRGGRGHRRRGRGVRTAPEGVRRDPRRREADGGCRQVLRQGEPRPLQGPARGRLPRRAAPQRDGQGRQAGCSRKGISEPHPGR